MYRTHYTRAKSRNLIGFAGVFIISACSTAVSESPEATGSDSEALLATACDTTGGNLTLTLTAGEVGYIGRTAGCTVEPCIVANAKTVGGALCKVNSTGKTITVTHSGGAGVEKVVIDYSAGLFATATTSTPLINVSLDTGSKLMIVAPNAGSNMALGVNGLDANTLAARIPARVDVAIGTGIDVLFNGGSGADVFTADVGGWPAAILPKGWDTGANITTAIGAAFPNALTANGGAGDDTLAGGAGANTLLGGAGNDTFLQGSNFRAEVLNGGDGVDTVDYGVRTAPVSVSVGANAGIGTITVPGTGDASAGYTAGDVLTVTGGKLSGSTITVGTVDGSGAILTAAVTTKGSGYAVATGLSASGGTGTGAKIDVATVVADDGDKASYEGDSVMANVEIVKGGAGNDILNAYAITTTDVVLIGNAGDDTLTGGSGNDDLCGSAGDDTFIENPGNDNLVGGIGSDTANYSTGTGVIACLNAADQVAGKPCATQNGATGEKDLVNGTLAKVCPRASLTIDLGGVATATTLPAAMAGGAMIVDVENLTGSPTAANALYCGTLSCTLFGGTAADTLWGGAAADFISGGGGADTIKTLGGADLVDLQHAGAAVTETVDCNNNQVTVLIPSSDTKAFTNCGSANVP